MKIDQLGQVEGNRLYLNFSGTSKNTIIWSCRIYPKKSISVTNDRIFLEEHYKVVISFLRFIPQSIWCCRFLIRIRIHVKVDYYRLSSVYKQKNIYRRILLLERRQVLDNADLSDHYSSNHLSSCSFWQA